MIINPYDIHTGQVYSTEAQEVIDNFGSAPTTGEQDKIAAFVDGCVTDSNWDKIENIVFFTLAGDNKYRYWKGSSLDVIKGDGATASTYPNVVSTGLENDGTRYINYNYNPTDDGGANISIDRFGFGTRVESIVGYGAGDIYGAMGTLDSPRRTWITYYETLSNDLNLRLFGGFAINHGTGAATPTGLLTAQVVRDTYPSGTLRIQGHIDGVLTANDTGTISTYEDRDFYGLALNSNNSPDTYHEGVVSMGMFYDPFGFDHSAFDIRLDTYLAAI